MTFHRKSEKVSHKGENELRYREGKGTMGEKVFKQ